jgi:hypothetical protein
MTIHIISNRERHKNNKKPCKPLHQCKWCKKVYAHKQSLSRHKSTCDMKDIPLTINEDKPYQCKYCNKSFSVRNNMYRHMKHYCKEKKKQEEEKDICDFLLSKVEALEDKITDLQNENIQLKTTKTVNKNNNNNNGTINKTVNNNNGTINKTVNNNNGTINNVNFNLVAFGKENLDVLTQEELVTIMKRGVNSVPALVEKLHFNPDRPENHNILVSNIHDKFLSIFNGTKWILKDKRETLETLFETGRDNLVIKYDDIKNNLDMNDKYNVIALKMFKRFNSQIDDNPLKMIDILKTIKLLMYNNRDIVLNTKKQLKDQTV